MSKSKLDILEGEIGEYDEESQSIIRSLRFQDQELVSLKSLKNNEGWKIVESRVRDELQSRIIEIVEEDPKVVVLLSLLRMADTRTMQKTLEDELQKVLPDG
jgi:hypothetical protein